MMASMMEQFSGFTGVDPLVNDEVPDGNTGVDSIIYFGTLQEVDVDGLKN